MAPVHERLGRLENDVSGLKRDMAEVKADIKDLKYRVIVLEDKVDVMRKDIDGMKADIDELKYQGEVTRSGVNTLLSWAENVESVVKVPLMGAAR